MQYRVKVYAQAETGESVFLGSKLVESSDARSAQTQAIDELWDPRLTCASCSPKAIIQTV